MNLVIVESSTKAKIIEKYLNSSTILDNGHFRVIASQGHVRDLAKKDMGIDTNTFECNFDIISDKKKIVSTISKYIKDSKMIYLASDNDREGEGIAWHIKTMFKIPDSKYKRLLFNEITKTALESSVINSTTINFPMVYSYLSRRILDRLVGFMITKLLWKSFDSSVTLTAGRVQSATLNIIITKEDEVSVFTSSPYWNIKGNFGKLLSDTTLYYKTSIYKSTDTIDIKSKMTSFVNCTFNTHNVVSKRITEKPPIPFITSSLQQVCYTSLNLPIKMTMGIAQDLYELGAITYMRTDSININQHFINMVMTYVESQHGLPYVQTKEHKTKTSKNAQEAHEAIRPTCLTKSYKFKTKKHEDLYKLIWDRTVAYFMSDAVYNEIIVSISSPTHPEYMFIGKEKTLIFNGWMKMYGKESSIVDTEDVMNNYLKMEKIPVSFVSNNVWTSPPRRYNESSIINKLETSGIGRPSTYASIMNKLFEKQYIEKKDIVGNVMEHIDYKILVKTKKLEENKHMKVVGDESKRLVPTEIGCIVNSFVSNNFKIIVDETFSSSMEDSLDKIAKNRIDYKTFLKNFYKLFDQDYQEVVYKLNLTDNKKGVGKDEHLINTIGDIQYIKRVTRYGPVIEKRSLRENTKSEYINLQAFLDHTDRKFNDIEYKDIHILLNTPLTIVHNNTDTYNLMYGRYGFYVKDLSINKTYRVEKQNVKYILKMDIDGFLKASKKKSW